MVKQKASVKICMFISTPYVYILLSSSNFNKKKDKLNALFGTFAFKETGSLDKAALRA